MFGSDGVDTKTVLQYSKIEEREWMDEWIGIGRPTAPLSLSFLYMHAHLVFRQGAPKGEEKGRKTKMRRAHHARARHYALVMAQ
jgi:hypothetical protein